MSSKKNCCAHLNINPFYLISHFLHSSRLVFWSGCIMNWARINIDYHSQFYTLSHKSLFFITPIFTFLHSNRIIQTFLGVDIKRVLHNYMTIPLITWYIFWTISNRYLRYVIYVLHQNHTPYQCYLFRKSMILIYI